MKIKVVKAKSGRELCTIEISTDKSVIELKKEIQKSIRIKHIRQRLKFGDVVLLNHRPISEFLGGNEATIECKDLGPQLRYKLLFIIEYLGPLITIPVFYYISKNKSNSAKFGAVLGFLHYFKRELESEFVHIFGNASVPVTGSFKNMFYYWFMYGILAVGEIFFFKAPASDWNKNYYYGFAALWAVFQFLNLKCHIVLRNLRIGADGKVDPHKRGVPSGYGFDTVTCANYLWEILGWITYTAMTKSWASGLFTVMGILQMAAWAKKKKRSLLKYFGEDEALVNKIKRKPALFPGIF